MRRYGETSAANYVEDRTMLFNSGRNTGWPDLNTKAEGKSFVTDGLTETAHTTSTGGGQALFLSSMIQPEKTKL